LGLIQLTKPTNQHRHLQSLLGNYRRIKDGSGSWYPKTGAGSFSRFDFFTIGSAIAHAQAATAKKPNILVIMGDDVGWLNIGAYHRGMMSGFDEFFGYLYHLDAMSSPLVRLPRRTGSTRDDATTVPRWGKVGKQRVEDEGLLAPFPQHGRSPAVARRPQGQVRHGSL
jgi:hypothetical protein